jgi:hypothetical protein
MEGFARSVRAVGRGACMIAMAGACALGGAFSASAADLYTPAPPETGTQIPSAKVTFGMRPYADNTFYVIGMKKGWFKDVGITVVPEPEGLKVTDNNVIALLLNGQVDMSSEFCPLILPTYKSSNKLKCVAFTDNFLGEAILANPKLKLKSFKDYTKEGKSFDEAIKAAIAPMQGKILVGAPELSDRPFEEAVSKFSGVTWQLQVLDDAKALVLAKGDRIDFANPEGAPIAFTLMQAGWTDLVDIGDLFNYGPGGLDSPIEHLVANVGIASNVDYINKNQNTVLRFLSVVWRIIDAVGKNPSLHELQAPYLNSVAGTSLDAAGVANTIHILDPLSPFDSDSVYYVDEKSVLYYKSAWTAIINDYAAHGLIPKDAVTADEIIWGAAIWRQMKDYQAKSDALLKGLEGKELSAEKKDLAGKAKQFYEWFDFLDAYRLASAAAG